MSARCIVSPIRLRAFGRTRMQPIRCISSFSSSPFFFTSFSPSASSSTSTSSASVSSSNSFSQGWHFEVLTPRAMVRIQEKDGELAKSKEKLKTAVADNERLRARALMSKTQAREEAIKQLARDVLEVKDELEQTIRGTRTYLELLSSSSSSSPEEQERQRREQVLVESFFQGVELSHKALLETMSRYGIEKMEPLGCMFDPEFHQGLSELEDATQAPGTVAAVLKDGYTLQGSVIRTAQVSTFKGPEEL